MNQILCDFFTNAAEWSCLSATHINFPQVGGSGGAVLYADQGVVQNRAILYLMYDYYAGATTASFFDVFFEVQPEGNSYLVRVPGASPLEVFERPIGTTAPILPNGSFDVGAGSGWTLLAPGDPDLVLGGFQGAVGFASSPFNLTPHPMAEFQLTIDRSATGGSGGLYSPEPAFWGASEKGTGGVDPPISSGIFMLNPDGTTVVVPVLGPDGAPIMQDTALPEPATFLGFGSGLLALLALRRYGSRAA